MTVSPMYFAANGQLNAQARAAALGIGLGPPGLPPVYTPAVLAAGGLPSIVAEYGTVVALFDDGTITPAQVTNLIAPLVAQQFADNTSAQNAITLHQNILNRQATIQAWIAANPGGAILTAAQTLVLAEMLNGVCDLLLNLVGNISGT